MTAAALLDAAIVSSREGDTATAQTHLLAAALALEAEGRTADARVARDLALSYGADRAEAALAEAREHGLWEGGGVVVGLRGAMFTIATDREVVVVPATDEEHALRVLRRLL